MADKPRKTYVKRPFKGEDELEITARIAREIEGVPPASVDNILRWLASHHGTRADEGSRGHGL
jgi:hypothetical protein